MKRSLPPTKKRNIYKKRRVESWHRKPAPAIDSTEDTLTFMQTSIEWSMDKNRKPIIHIYGVTEGKNTVLCHVKGFLPYLYFATPANFSEDNLPHFKRMLFKHLGDERTTVEKFEIVRRCSIYGFCEETSFIKVTLNNPYKLKKFSNAFDEWPVYENEIDFVMRFMFDTGVVGMNWIELPAGSYTNSLFSTSHCQYEVEVSHDKIVSHPAEGSMSNIAPLRILSFDIECTGLESKNNKVIQIGNFLSEPPIKVIFTLGGCSSIDGVTIHSFNDEKSLLTAWRDFVVETDPDIFTGYNINGFDFDFLFKRANLLGFEEFGFLGRKSKAISSIRPKETTTKARGTRKTNIIEIQGRVSLDMSEVIRHDVELPSYKLKDVCEHFLLTDRKIDLPYQEMLILQDGSDDDRRRIAKYCLKDAELPLQLMKERMVLPNYAEMARVTGVPLSYLLTRGQQIKILSQIYRRANANGYIIPTINPSNNNGEKYEGATVIKPMSGYYNIPIATLDFSSLYPSIMRAHNFCYTTLVNPKIVEAKKLVLDKDYIITPHGDMFLSPSKRQGLLPQILQDLVEARKNAKADLEKEPDPLKYAVLDGRQLALKIVANSVYGFTGAQKGYLPCLPIAASVTSIGREMIEKTQKLVEAKYTKKKGYDHNAKVIYGDTDSVMINFGYTDLARVMKLGKRAAKYVTGEFSNPIKLEFEKAYFPYLLIGKKRYAGVKWTNTEKFDKVDIKGIDIVRRDRCVYVQNVMRQCLDLILIHRNYNQAVKVVQQSVSDLLRGNVKMELLTFTKGWNKADYVIKPPHVKVAKRIMDRDPNVKIGVGDRISYVVTAGAKGSLVGDRAEELQYVKENNLPIDTKYYREQLRRPLLEIFAPVLGGTEKATEILFIDSHISKIVKAPVTLPPIFLNFTAEKRCKKCRNPLKKCTCNIIV